MCFESYFYFYIPSSFLFPVLSIGHVLLYNLLLHFEDEALLHYWQSQMCYTRVSTNDFKRKNYNQQTIKFWHDQGFIMVLLLMQFIEYTCCEHTFRSPMLTTGCSGVDNNHILLGFEVNSLITFLAPIVFSNITCACLNPRIDLPSLSGWGHKLSSFLLPSFKANKGVFLNILTS